MEVIPTAAFAPVDDHRRVTQQDGIVSMKGLRELSRVISRFAAASRLDDVRVFGSVARGEQTDASDVDLLVTPQAGATLFGIAQFELDLEELLGVPVAVVSDRALDPVKDARIMREAVPL